MKDSFSWHASGDFPDSPMFVRHVPNKITESKWKKWEEGTKVINSKSISRFVHWSFKKDEVRILQLAVTAWEHRSSHRNCCSIFSLWSSYGEFATCHSVHFETYFGRRQLVVCNVLWSENEVKTTHFDVSVKGYRRQLKVGRSVSRNVFQMQRFVQTTPIL
jgi:hypothetical protein